MSKKTRSFVSWCLGIAVGITVGLLVGVGVQRHNHDRYVVWGHKVKATVTAAGPVQNEQNMEIDDQGVQPVWMTKYTLSVPDKSGQLRPEQLDSAYVYNKGDTVKVYYDPIDHRLQSQSPYYNPYGAAGPLYGACVGAVSAALAVCIMLMLTWPFVKKTRRR